MKTFFTSFFQIGLITINTYFISQLYWVGIFFFTSYGISLLWVFDLLKISVSTLNEKLIYALGAGCGAITGLVLIRLFIK